MTKNRNKHGIKNTKKGVFSRNQLTLSNSFVEAATWLPSLSVSVSLCVSLSPSDLCQETGPTTLTP